MTEIALVFWLAFAAGFFLVKAFAGRSQTPDPPTGRGRGEAEE